MRRERLPLAWCAAALLLAGCSVSKPAPKPQPAASGPTFGTDAELAASSVTDVLRYANHSRGFAELRMPEGAGPFPLAVIFHGGCWKTGIANTAYMGPLATRWQQQGVATLNVDYREVGDGGGWPASFEDWQAAADLIERVAARYPIDRAAITLVGHSAGALPALWLVSPQDAGSPVGERDALDARAAIVLDGPGELAAEQPAFDALCEFSAVEPFMGGLPADRPARYAAIAPRPALQEVLFVQAVLPSPPDAALASIRSGGARVSVRSNAGASHFSILTPGDPVYAANEPAILRVLKGR